jgi:hypothetical protein
MRLPRPLGLLLLCAAALCASAGPLFAGFSSGLSAEDRAACGIRRLSAAQVAALDEYVARDVALAHEGGVTGFSMAFTARLSPAEAAAAGIAALTAGERTDLDRLAARDVAVGPPPEQAFVYSPRAPAAAPVPKGPPANPVLSAIASMEVHGDVSFTVGGGSKGRSFYGTSVDLYATDPTGHFTLGVGLDDYRGRGLFLPPGAYPELDPFVPGPPWLGY